MLTKKEKEIFELNAKCYSRQELCKILDVTKSTLNTHLNNMAVKLELPDRMNIQYYLACLYIKGKNE